MTGGGLTGTAVVALVSPHWASICFIFMCAVMRLLWRRQEARLRSVMRDLQILEAELIADAPAEDEVQRHSQHVSTGRDSREVDGSGENTVRAITFLLCRRTAAGC